MDVVALLRETLGDRVSTESAALETSRTDKSGWVSDAAPLALVSAESVEDVQAVMRIASATGAGVVPRGAGTGLAGGAAGTAGTIVLSLARMNRILEISIEDELARVEPGVINGDLVAALRPYGLWFAPDPASRAISSIGGNIATGAGGLACAKYGVTREAVLGLSVVLADGTLLRTGHRTVKGVTGYDLTALFVGSEGTLGVVVEATLRVRPVPAGDVVTMAAFYSSARAAAADAAAIVAAGLRPTVLELIDGPALTGIVDYLGEVGWEASGIELSVANWLAGEGVENGGLGAFLVAQFDESPDAARCDAAARIMGAGSADGVRVSADAAEGEELLAVRRAFHPAMEARGRVLIEDVAVPRSRLADMFDRIAEIGQRHGIAIPTVAHAADGNLHPNFVFDGAEVPQNVWDAADELFRAALDLGGTLTGEHGVGVLKRHHLRQELGGESDRLQREIKRAFDPQGILNPGKVFD